MIEWKQGEPPRDGKWYLVLHWNVADVMAYEQYEEGSGAWWNGTSSFVNDDDFRPDYWAEINLPDGYYVTGASGDQFWGKK